MKVKVKGLVFVGFAAAILSANAALADPDNTVTSKAYVDNKFQTINNIQTEFTEDNKNSTTQYPSMSAVQAKITEVGGTVNNSTISVTQNGTSIGSFTTNQSSGSTLAIAGADWNAASGTAGYIDNKPTVDTTFNATSTNAATSAAIADYVGTQLTSNQADWAETTTTDPSYIQNKPTQLSQFTDNIDAANAIDSITVGGTAVTPDSNKAVALGAAAGKGADTTITSSASDNNVPTSKAVYDYVDALPAADIPAMPTTGTDACDATHPCALVTDANGDPVWKRIAQAGDQ